MERVEGLENYIQNRNTKIVLILNNFYTYSYLLLIFLSPLAENFPAAVSQSNL